MTAGGGGREPVAIVGMACRFPGGISSPDEFWKLLRDNGETIGEIPPDRWRPYAEKGPEYAKAVRRAIRHGGYLDDVAGFDADFFGISPREAELMDPQQRVTLEVAWEALEHAAVAPAGLAGGDASVFMGVCTDDYGRRLLEDLPRLEAWTGIGSSMCAVANRVSYALDLRGPSVTVDTACSASLVAIHQACQSLRAGETSLALAGGVMLVASPGFALVLDAAGALSPDGTSKAFDAAANGYVRSEGCAVVALKRLADAERDGDRVLAVIRGSAVRQDGRTNGIMAPSREAQEQLVDHACAAAGISPADLGYVEAHGTGTGVGDPIEVAALAATAGRDRPVDRPCLIGSVKSNIGHLEAASGVAGVIKAVLALRHDEIPATLARAELNPAIDWAGSGLTVVRENTPWPPSGDGRRLCGIANYGYGGTLAHVIVEAAPPLPSAAEPALAPAPAAEARTLVFPLSGASEAGLRANAERLAAWVAANPEVPLDEVGSTLARGRTALGVRACVLAADCGELTARLGHVAAGRPAAGIAVGRIHRDTAGPGAVWVFSGHGAQWAGMGRELLATEPLLGATFDEIEEIYRAELGVSPRELVFGGTFDDVGHAQAMIFAMQVGLARIWRARGLAPAAIIGHSVGEIAAAVTAGMLDLPDAARLICRRSRLLRRVAGQGAMVMLNVPFEEAETRLAGCPDVTAAIAAAPASTVLSGSPEAIEWLLPQCKAEGLAPRRVASDVAFHGPQMDGLVPDLLTAAADVTPHPAAVPVYSTALADARTDAPRDAAYWAANLRDPVRFRDAVAAAAEDGHRVFLEVSTHPVVSHSVMETLAANGIDDGVVVPTLRRHQPERDALHTALGTLHCHGVPVDWSVLYPVRRPVHLPATAWQHRRYWVDAVAAAGPAQLLHDVEGHTVLGHRVLVQCSPPLTLWQTRVDDESRPYPGGHRVLGTEVIPAAVVLTSFLAAGADAGGLADVDLRVPVALTSPRDVQVVSQDSGLTLSSRLADQTSDRSWLTHASARVLAVEGDGGLQEPVPAASDAERLDPGCVMARLADIGVAGIGFPWTVSEVRRTAKHLHVRIEADPGRRMPLRTWGSLFDAGLSAAPMVFPGEPRLRMPGRLREVTVHGAPPDEALVSVRLVDVRWNGDLADDVEVDVTIADPDGMIAARLSGVRFGVVPQGALPEPGPADAEADEEGPGWRALAAPELREHVHAAVRTVVAAELRMDPAELDVHRPLPEMGIDSLLSESIRQRLARLFTVALPSSLLWDRPSATAVSDYLADLLGDTR